MLCIRLRRLSVHPDGAVLARAPIRLAQPVDVDVVGERREASSGACRASSAIVCCLVEMVSGLVVRHRSSQTVRNPAPPSLHGVPRVGSPASTVLRGAPTPCRPSRRTSLPSLGGTALALAGSLPWRPSAAAAGLELGHPVTPPGSRAETAGPPRFLGNPAVHMPCSSTPAGPPRQAIAAPRCCLPLLNNVGSHDTLAFGAQSHGLFTRCLRFVVASPAATQDSLPAAGQALPGGIGYPLGSFARFQSSLHLVLPAQACPGALKSQAKQLSWRILVIRSVVADQQRVSSAEDLLFPVARAALVMRPASTRALRLALTTPGR